jgi:DNA-binding XRE family transcriptional regulator
LKIVKLLEEEMTCPRFTGFLGGMSQAKRKTATPTSPRSTDAIGARLLTTREVLGYDGRQQASYANQAGIAPNRYNQWERGHVRINLDGAMQLCLRYGLTLDWIYFGDRSCLPSRIAEKLPPETL